MREESLTLRFLYRSLSNCPLAFHISLLPVAIGYFRIPPLPMWMNLKRHGPRFLHLGQSRGLLPVH
jgi:hypothetical protein